MMRRKAAAWMAAGVTLVGTALAGAIAPAHAATTYRLYVSTHSNRSHAVKLGGQTLHGSVYIFALPGAGALRVKFFLDDPGKRHQPMHTETSPPYDLQGGQPTQPIAWKTDTLVNGKHRLTIQVDLSGGKSVTSSSSFIVRNLPPKPSKVRAVAGKEQVTVSWHSGKGSTSGFYVYRSTHSHVPLSHPISGSRPLGPGARMFKDKNVKPGVRYYYVVVAVNLGHGKAAARAVRTAHAVQVSPLSVFGLKPYGFDQKAQLRWGIHGTADHVRIFRGVGSVNLSGTPLATLSGHATIWTDKSGLADGTTYSYVVQLVRGTRRVNSAAVQVTPVGAPTAVSGTGNSAGIKVTWTHDSVGVKEFIVYRSTTTTFDLTSDAVGSSTAPATSFTDKSAVAGTAYYYLVQTISLNHAHAESHPSNAVTRVAGPAIGNTVSTDGTVTVNWTANGAGVTGYQIYRGTTGSAVNITIPANRIIQVGPTVSSYDDSGLPDGTRFYYVVRAIAGSSFADSAVKPGTPIAAPVVDPPTIDNLGDVKLTWSASNDGTVTSYKIFRSTSSSVALTGGNLVGTVGSSLHTWQDNVTVNGTKYYYVVQAYYAGGHAESGTVNATPNPPTAVSNLVATGTVDSISLTWDTVDSNATSLEIFRSSTAGVLGTSLTPLADNLLTYVDTDVMSGDTWYYTVRTYSDGGYTDSDQVSATVGP